MPYEFCQDHKEHARAIKVHDERLKSHSADIDKQREDQFEIRIAIQRLVDIQAQMQSLIEQNEKALARQDDRIAALEDQPANDAKRIKDAALAAIGGAIGTAVIALVVLALVQSVHV